MTHYHLIGIAGTAMGSLAGLLREKGHRVTGSDEGVYPPMSDLLDELGIEYATSFRPGNLEPEPDVVIVGNAISRGNEELEAVLERRIPYTSAARTLYGEFLEGRHVLAVAGTHGKTTTASLLAWLLESAGLDPSFLIGGVAENFGSTFRLTDSEYFVVEADEYDTAYFDKGPKMWHYRPWTAVVTNVEYDHADIYRDEEAYRFAFERFVNLVPRTGTLVLGWDTAAARALAEASFAPVHSFDVGEGPGAEERSAVEEASGVEAEAGVGEAPGVDGGTDPAPTAGPSGAAEGHPRWVARGVSHGAGGTRFTVVHDGEPIGSVDSPLSGTFNVRNQLAAVAAARSVGAAWEDLRTGLATFRSVRRRMELRGEVDGVAVVDDFAHHPTAVRATVQAARERFPGRRIVAVFEPRSYTAQRREFQDPYRDALGRADRVVVAGLFHPERYDEETGLDPEALAAELRADGVDAEHVAEVERIVEAVAPAARHGDVLLVMSNGAFGGIHEKLLRALEARDPA